MADDTSRAAADHTYRATGDDTSPATRVIVVGAGPVGLFLAGELRLGGADVVVLERLRTPTTESRASTLHARTAELFDCRGLWTRSATRRGSRAATSAAYRWT